MNLKDNKFFLRERDIKTFHVPQAKKPKKDINFYLNKWTPDICNEVTKLTYAKTYCIIITIALLTLLFVWLR